MTVPDIAMLLGKMQQTQDAQGGCEPSRCTKVTRELCLPPGNALALYRLEYSFTAFFLVQTQSVFGMLQA